MVSNKILVIDIETTGFNHQEDCILELGIVSLDLNNGSIEELFNATFKEKHLNGSHLNAWIFKNSDMKHETIRKSKDIDFYAPKIQVIFDQFQDKVVAFNRPFDIDFLKSRGFKFGLDCLDPMRESTDYFKLPHKNGRRGNKWPNVEEAYGNLFPNRKYVEQHRGLDDAKHEAEIVFELIKRNVYKLR